MKKINKETLKIFIALSFLASSGVGVISNCYGIFYDALQEALNTNKSLVVFYTTIISLCNSISSLIVPKILTQENYRKLLLLTNGITSLCLVLIGQAISLIQVYILAVFIGVGLGFFSNVVLNLLVVSNLKENIGKYSSFIFCFTGITGSVLSPILTGIIENYSYSAAYLVSGILCFVFALPIQFVNLKIEFNTNRIEQRNTNYSQSLFVIYIIMSFLFFVTSAYPQHFLAYSHEKGFTNIEGSYFLSAAMLGNVIFKPINGYLADKFNSIKTAMMILIINIAGSIILLKSNNYYLLILGCVLYGNNYSLTSFMHALLCREIFKDNFYVVHPKMNFAGTVGSCVAGVLIAFTYDMFDSYIPALIAIIFLNILNLSFLFYIDKSKYKAQVCQK